MKLSQQQLRQFDEEGYLFFPDYFSPAETEILKRRSPGVFQQRREENVREKTGDVVRTAFAVHTYHPVFEALIHHPRFVEPAEQLLKDKTYIHQFKINGKAAFDGDVWQWHQDYGTWKADDDMPEARAMNLAVFVDEVNEFNGPLWFIPKSHKKGAIEAKHDLTTTSYPLWVIDNDTIAKLVEAGRHRGAQGRAGLGDLLPRHAGARQPAQHVAVGPPDHLRDLQRGLERHPPLQAAGLYRASRLHADRCLGRRCRDCAPRAQGRRGITREEQMNLHRMLLERAAENKPLRIGLIGAGKFGAMYLSQIPTTPGIHLLGIADLSPPARRRTWRGSAGSPRSRRRLVRRGARTATPS
jgi:ectoine hydroxylase